MSCRPQVAGKIGGGKRSHSEIRGVGGVLIRQQLRWCSGPIQSEDWASLLFLPEWLGLGLAELAAESRGELFKMSCCLCSELLQCAWMAVDRLSCVESYTKTLGNDDSTPTRGRRHSRSRRI
jgi:hypothetical protein